METNSTGRSKAIVAHRLLATRAACRAVDSDLSVASAALLTCIRVDEKRRCLWVIDKGVQWRLRRLDVYFHDQILENMRLVGILADFPPGVVEIAVSYCEEYSGRLTSVHTFDSLDIKTISMVIDQCRDKILMCVGHSYLLVFDLVSGDMDKIEVSMEKKNEWRMPPKWTSIQCATTGGFCIRDYDWHYWEGPSSFAAIPFPSLTFLKADVTFCPIREHNDGMIFLRDNILYRVRPGDMERPCPEFAASKVGRGVVLSAGIYNPNMQVGFHIVSPRCITSILRTQDGWQVKHTASWEVADTLQRMCGAHTTSDHKGGQAFPFLTNDTVDSGVVKGNRNCAFYVGADKRSLYCMELPPLPSVDPMLSPPRSSPRTPKHRRVDL